MAVESTAGDHERFVALLNPVLPSAYAVALRLSRNDSDAEDLLQEASLRAFAGFRTFRPDSNFRAWFLKILSNCFNARWRKAKREPVTVDFDRAPSLYMFRRSLAEGAHDTPKDPATDILSKLDCQQVEGALRAIPEEYRIVCTLYFVEDLSYQQIAEVLDSPIGTVRSRLHRGRRMLQKSLWRLAREQGITTPSQQE